MGEDGMAAADTLRQQLSSLKNETKIYISNTNVSDRETQLAL